MADGKIHGRPVTDEAIQKWAAEAEAGYDIEKLRTRGRPTIGAGPGTVVPVRMDETLLNALDERAQCEHIPRSEAIRAAVRAWIQVV
ncbi:ribbon-helix-helix domain-containing protein [Rhodococcus pyridinivorans]|uniref:ribbon-helix-helix domain-containing protein n=1 Tax=Rhodococcus pyridinivorans TaxID=103816 RepID=UPI001E50B53A|nr:ribbon-helix-helix domain-containing protein [Rhodococcus pyridinivorans]MCD5422685.1 ribbon-helix-helix domain-containing protein [Rhodococcus pyridinivorans]